MKDTERLSYWFVWFRAKARSIDTGRLSFWFDRFRARLNILNFFMIGYLFLERSGWHWWYLVIIITGIVFMYFDIKYILPKEREYAFTRSKTIREICKATKKQTKN